MYRSLLKPLFFRFDAEAVHHFVFASLQILLAVPPLAWLAQKLYGVAPHPGLEREVFGLRFPNPIGLAAGFDKNALLVPHWHRFGFGFVEIGTVTPRPQAGNDKPRLFRLPADQALLNRMGFNNDGAEVIAQRLKRRNPHLIVGGNLGKNKDTPNEQALDDYLLAYRALYEGVDYFVVNVSSPNTPGLRALQDKEPLLALLTALLTENRQQARPKPILLKIAPDLSDAQLDDIIDIVAQTRLDGVIATNTTISRAGLSTPAEQVQALGAGGISGAPVRSRSTEVVRYLHQKSGGAFPIIAVGGLFSAADAQEKLQAGASLVQVYSGFVYEGPGLARRMAQGLLG